MKKLAILFLVFSAGFSSMAQNKTYTLNECIAIALEENISIKQGALDLELADVDKLTAIGNFLPSVSASLGASKSTGLSFDPVTNNAQTTTFLSGTGRINVGYTLFDGLRNIRQIQRADLQKLASQYQLDKIQDDIALFVANAYLDILLSKANLNAIQSQNDVTKEQIERTQALVDAVTNTIVLIDLFEQWICAYFTRNRIWYFSNYGLTRCLNDPNFPYFDWIVLIYYLIK